MLCGIYIPGIKGKQASKVCQGKLLCDVMEKKYIGNRKKCNTIHRFTLFMTDRKL